MASEQVENYLKNIYKLEEQGGRVTTSSLSEQLQISAPSVTEMIKKLAEEGSVTYTPYKGVELTERGRKKALRIIRRHRLWELFLVEVLKYDWDEIDEEAERLEHITSEKLEQRLDKALGFPRRDPHGDIIPSPEGNLEAVNHRLLSDVKPGVVVLVSRVSDSSPEVLQYAAKLGILLKRKIKVKERIEFDGSLRVEIGKKEQFISSKLAKSIFVEIPER
ncbi:MAG: metal-dependent transcriptional regulator [Ignavibacteriales bacterium]|nr:metal-dependent transcriptional regulator [Ignavibacteriales bacterium]